MRKNEGAREILMQAGSELKITANLDGTYTARIGLQEKIFPNFMAAVEWACSVRDGGKREK